MMLNEKQEKLKELLENNIKNEKVGIAIAITGSWGVGKTYFWNTFRENNPLKKKYVYVSLFGLESLSDLKTHIYSNIENNHSVLEIPRWIRGLPSILKDTRVSQFGVNASVKVFDNLMFHQVKDAIICFDDFERMSNKLDIKDVMGLANQLKLEKNCQIILILDESKTEDKNKEKYAEYKEKLIDETIKITSVEPLIRENAKDIDEKLVELMVEFAEKLEIHNFRFFQKVIKLYKQFREQLPEQVAYPTKERILISVLQGYFIEDFGALFKVNWNDFTTKQTVRRRLDKENNKKEASESENLQLAKLEKISYLFVTDNLWMIEFKKWFEQKEQLNSNVMYELANSELISERVELLKAQRNQLWDQFWNNKIDIGFPKQLFDRTLLLIGVLDIENLDSTCTILNKLGAVELANELSDKIYQWINKELKEDQLGFIDNFASWKREKNEFYDYIDKYQEEHLYEGLPSLLETVHQYTINNGWSPKHIRSLEVASKNDWKELLFEKIPNDERFQHVNSNLIASKMIKQSMKPEFNQDIKKIIIEIYEEKGQARIL